MVELRDGRMLRDDADATDDGDDVDAAADAAAAAAAAFRNALLSAVNCTFRLYSFLTIRFAVLNSSFVRASDAAADAESRLMCGRGSIASRGVVSPPPVDDSDSDAAAVAGR